MSESQRNPELILRRLEWTVIRRLDGLLHGDYRTLFRGFGLDLADLREYNEDRDVTAWFLLDLSPSTDFGSRDVRKRGVSIEFVTVLARLLSRHGNRVGALFYGDRVDTVLPARGGRRHVLQLLHLMLTRPERTGASATRLKDLLDTAFPVMSRRSLVFVVSDFVSAPGWAESLARVGLRHEIVAVRLFDPLEMQLPDLGLLVMQDAETGEQLFVDTHDRAFRKRFARAAERRERDLRAAFRQAGVDALELSTEDDLVDAVMRFADLRKRRSQLSGGGLPQHLESNRDVPVA